MVTQMSKTKLLMWDIGKNLGGTRKYMERKEPELEKRIIQCIKVLECIIKELIASKNFKCKQKISLNM